MLYIFPLLAGIFYGIGGLLNKKIAKTVSGPVLSGVLFNFFSFLTSILLVIYEYSTSEIYISRIYTDWLLLIISTFLSVFAFWGLFTSLQNLPVSEQILLSRASVLTYTLGGILLLGENVTGIKALGLLIILLGIIISSIRKGKFVFNKWAIIQVISSIGFGFTVIIDNVISQNFSSGIYVLIQVFTSMLGLIILGYLLKEFPTKEKLSSKYIGVSLLAGLVSILGYFFVIKSYSLGGFVSISGAIGQIKIPIAVLGGYFIYKERENLLPKIIGAVTVIIGLILIKF